MSSFGGTLSMDPAGMHAISGNGIPGMFTNSAFSPEIAPIMAAFYGNAIGTKFGTDEGMSPQAHHEFTLQALVGQRAILQEQLVIQRTLNSQKLGLAVLSPMRQVNALRVQYTRRELLPVLIGHGSERTMGRSTQRRESMYEFALDRWTGGDQFGVEALTIDASILDESRAQNLDGLLSSLDFNVWAEARHAHDLAMLELYEGGMLKESGGYVPSVTSHMVEHALERVREFTFLFNRDEEPLTFATNRIKMYQQQYGGYGDTWFVHQYFDLVRRENAVGAGARGEYYRYGPGAAQVRTAALGATVPGETEAGTQVYLMSTGSFAGLKGLDVMERAMIYGEFYVQGLPNCKDSEPCVDPNDATIHLMTVHHNTAQFQCWTLQQSLDACGMFNSDGSIIDIINGDANGSPGVDQAMVQSRLDAQQEGRFSEWERRHSFYYFDSNSQQRLVKFMGQMESYSLSAHSMLKLARSVACRLINRSGIEEGLARLERAMRVIDGIPIKGNEEYLRAMFVATGGGTAAKTGLGLKSTLRVAEMNRDNYGGFALPAARDGVTYPRLPPGALSYGMLRSIAAAFDAEPSAQAFSAKYGLSGTDAADVSTGIRALEDLSQQLSVMVPNSVFNSANFAPDYEWNPTPAAALYGALYSGQMLPLFIRNANDTAEQPEEVKVSELANIAEQAATVVMDKFTGRLGLENEPQGRLIGANVNNPTNDAERVVVISPVVGAGVGPKLAANTTINVANVTGAGGITYLNLVALIFNSRPADALSPADKLLVERNRAAVLTLAGAITAGDNAAQNATNVDAFINNVAKQILGTAPSRTARTDTVSNAYATAASLQEYLKANTSTLSAFMDSKQFPQAYRQLPGIYERYATLIKNAPLAIDSASDVKPGGWVRTALMVGKGQIQNLDPAGAYMPADPAYPARPIAPAQYNILRAGTLATNLTKAKNTPIISRHFASLIQAANTPGAVDEYSGLTFGELLANYQAAGPVSSASEPIDLFSGIALSDDASVGVTAADLAEMASESFIKNWTSIDQPNILTLDKAIAKVFTGAVHNKGIYEAAIQHRYLPPIRFLLARFLRLRTLAALFAARGGRAMQTPFAFPRFYQGQATSTQEFAYVFHLWAKPIVVDQDGLYWLDDVQIREYVGGWTLNPVDPRAVRNETNPAMLHTHGDLWVVVQPFEPTQYPAYLPLTGHRADYAPSAPSAKAINDSTAFPNAYGNEILYSVRRVLQHDMSQEALMPTNGSPWQSAVQLNMPNLWQGTARFHASSGKKYIQMSTGPLQSQFVNSQMSDALFSGRTFVREDLKDFEASNLTSIQARVAVY